jgi:DNA-binding NarL/FixJ family response regulator
MIANPIRVIVADDHVVVRAGLRAVLGMAKDIEVIGEASTGREAVEMAERLAPDVIVMDLDMPDLDGAGATREILAKGLTTRVLVLTMHVEEDYLVPVMKAGAAGYLVKSAADRELVDAVRRVAHGDVYMQPAAARVLARSFTKKVPVGSEREQFQKLTQRERDVLRFVAQGYSEPEIGERMVISTETIDACKLRIHDKLGLEHRAEYVQFALKLGLLTDT